MDPVDPTGHWSPPALLWRSDGFEPVETPSARNWDETGDRMDEWDLCLLTEVVPVWDAEDAASNKFLFCHYRPPDGQKCVCACVRACICVCVCACQWLLGPHMGRTSGQAAAEQYVSVKWAVM